MNAWSDVFGAYIRTNNYDKAQLVMKLDKFKANGVLIDGEVNGVYVDEYQDILQIINEAYPE